MSVDLTAECFVERLETLRSEEELQKIQRYFKTGKGDYGEGDMFIGVRMGQVFELAREFIDMPPDEIEKLLESPIHEVRAGAMSIMGKSAAHKKTSSERKKELFDLYLRRHDRINNWDLVDLAAQYVLGSYLFDKPRDILYKLAVSENLWERRSAILATFHFLRKGELDDCYKIAEILLNDEQDLVHKSVGWVLRTAGDHDRPRLEAFLNKYAATMPRTLLRYSIEHFDKVEREQYMRQKKQK
jgi:3-methyladenine DNA glycosylase AlkD